MTSPVHIAVVAMSATCWQILVRPRNGSATNMGEGYMELWGNDPKLCF